MGYLLGRLKIEARAMPSRELGNIEIDGAGVYLGSWVG
jgi:hypothetical protein